MKNLYFQRSTGGYLLVKENVVDVDEAYKEVSDFLKRHNYACHYIRYWTHGDETTFDVGSWSEFFKLAPADSRFEDKLEGTEKDFIDKRMS